MKDVLVDTGPLVAMLNRHDVWHTTCAAAFKSMRCDLLSTWPVLTEAAYLLRHQPRGLVKLFDLVRNKVIRIAAMDKSAMPWISKFYDRFQDQQPDLADASLVYLAEHLNLRTVFTLDRRHFSVYRVSRNRSLRLLPEATAQ